MPENKKPKTFLELEEERLKQLEKTKRAFKKSEEAMELWKSTQEMFERLHKPVLTFFSAIANAIPPIKLVVSACATIWDVGTTLIAGKQSKAHQATKIGIAVTGLTLTVTAFAVPVIAAGTLIAGAALNFAKESVSCVRAWRAHSTHKTFIAKKIEALHIAKKEQSHELVASHQTELKQLHEEKEVLQTKAVNKTVQHVLTGVALVGAVLLPIIPPVGAILLVASAILGVAHAFGKWLFGKKSKKQEAVAAPVPEPQKTTEAARHQQHHTRDEDEQTNALNKHEPESTAHIYLDFAAKATDVKQEAVHELQHAIETLEQEPKPVPKPHHELDHVEEFFHEPAPHPHEEVRHIHQAGKSPKPKQTPPEPRDAP